MTECPHCGGKSGYQYRVTIEGIQWNEWNGEAVNFENSTRNSSGGHHGIKRCIDCGKKVSLEIKIDP